MKRVRSIKISFNYSDTEDSPKQLSLVYGRLFNLARHRLIERQKPKTEADLITKDKENKIEIKKGE